MINSLLLFANSTASIKIPDGNTTTSYSTGLPTVNASSSELQAVLQIVFGIITAVTVLVIVISGLRFVLSQGNPENVTKARETIIYALVGLVISLTAEILVSFVLFKLS
jgi:hypothetical protein